MHVGSITLCAPDELGWYCVQIDGLGEGGCGAWFETQPTFGFASRPVDRDESGSCNVLYSFDGSAWVGHDRRYSAKCPPLTQGSSAQWNSGGAFALLDTTTETWQLYVPRGSGAHLVTVGQDANGASLIELRHQNGSYLSCNADGWMMRASGAAYVQVNGSKIILNGEVTTTASMTVGGPAGQPVVNATAFGIILASLSATLSNATPVTPYEITLHAALLALTAAFPLSCNTQMLKAV